MITSLYGGYGLFYGFDIYYLILVIPTLLISLWAQAKVKRTFHTYSQQAAVSGMTGRTAAERIIERLHLDHVRIERVSGQLTDHYDPRSHVLRLSDATYASPSIAAIGVAAHEAGHAAQHEEDYLPNKIRGALVPVARIGSSMGPLLAIFGIIMTFQPLITIGIYLFFGAVLFYLVTLPVEFNASARAIRVLEEQDILTRDELDGARKVLRAAALTYVASALAAIANLLRLVLLSRGRGNRR
ncbi:MAG: zinc metallopeptidase [Eubacteriales bacterium]|nr:zinc metallopeptidase [Eubacteriales bacterium]